MTEHAEPAGRVERPAELAVPAVAPPLSVPPRSLARHPSELLALQRTAGNAAVGRLLQRDALDDYNAAEAALLAFYQSPHRRRNNRPSTGRGLFDVEYNPWTSELEIKVKLKFSFVNGSAAEFPAASAADLTWTRAASQRYKRDFMRTVSRHWSSRHTFYCTRDWWENLEANVVVRAVEVSRNEHYAVTVHKIPVGGFKVSSVTPPTVVGGVPHGVAEFDSEDLKYVNKPGNARQRAAVHEFGHMLGLGDEYPTAANPNAVVAHSALVRAEFGHRQRRRHGRRIMAGGERIDPEHGVTFLEALKRATGISDWSHRRKARRRRVPLPVGDFPAPGEIPSGRVDGGVMV